MKIKATSTGRYLSIAKDTIYVQGRLEIDWGNGRWTQLSVFNYEQAAWCATLLIHSIAATVVGFDFEHVEMESELER